MPRLFTYYEELSLNEGFALMTAVKKERHWNGVHVSPPSAKSLYSALVQKGSPLKCWNCGAPAHAFVLARETQSHEKLCLKLLAIKDNTLLELTRDHIIPKSKGGSNAVKNLRVGCAPCNNSRGDEMDEEESRFMQSHPRLHGDLGKSLENIRYYRGYRVQVPRLRMKNAPLALKGEVRSVNQTQRLERATQAHCA